MPLFNLGKKDDLEMTALLSLKLVEVTLEKQGMFTHFLRMHNSSVIVTPLDQLLLGVGAQSGTSDCILQIARLAGNVPFLLHFVNGVNKLVFVFFMKVHHPQPYLA